MLTKALVVIGLLVLNGVFAEAQEIGSDGSSATSLDAISEVQVTEPVQSMSIRRDDVSGTPEWDRKWSAELYLELRSLNSRDERPIVKSRQSIQEAEASFGFEIDPGLDFRITGASEQFNGQSEFYLKEAFFNYSPAPRWATLRLGQKLMSIGLLNEMEHSFSSNPAFYEKLWTAKKGIDLGAELEFYPFEEKFIYLKGSIYSGQIVRPGDSRLDMPEQSPREFSLRSHSKYHDAFVSRFEQDLAFVDPIVANGAGINAQTRELLPYGFELKLFSEIWDMSEVQTQGPNESTLGYFVFPSVRWKNASVGYRYSEAKSSVGQNDNAVDLPTVTSRMVRAQVDVTKHFAIMAEQLTEISDRVLRDELVVRAVVDWKLE